MFGNRPLSTILRSVFQRRHYFTLWHMYRNYPAFKDALKRYLWSTGNYPYRIQIKTPTRNISPTLHSHHDMLTVNEIFCRQDYFADAKISVVVDLGSNIGISALYFLTRNSKARCYLFEPDGRNIERLRLNLTGFETRYSLRKEAVADFSGRTQFGIERTGRYGGIGIKTGQYIEVDCLDVNEVLQDIIEKESVIDVLKIDTEGVEIRTVKAIRKPLLERIKHIYLEAYPKEELYPTMFEQHQYGSVCQLRNRFHT